MSVKTVRMALCSIVINVSVLLGNLTYRVLASIVQSQTVSLVLGQIFAQAVPMALA